MDELARLTREYPLPDGCRAPELFRDEVVIAGRRLGRAGLASSAPDGTEFTGSAAELDASPIERAYFELLERAAILGARGRACELRDGDGAPLGGQLRERDDHGEGPTRPARSNGVALHRTWAEACRRARNELVERDRILRSWYGELPVVEVAPPAILRDFETHHWRACCVPDDDALTRDVHVVAVVGLPRGAELPLARGFAAAESLEGALDAAAREALQGLAFVWGEPLPESVAPAPTPIFHLDYYLVPSNHGHVVEWLDGRHRSGERPARSRAPIRYVDLTPEPLRGRLSVARAVRDDARPLEFGWPACRSPGLPGSEVHPIP